MFHVRLSQAKEKTIWDEKDHIILGPGSQVLPGSQLMTGWIGWIHPRLPLGTVSNILLEPLLPRMDGKTWNIMEQHGTSWNVMEHHGTFTRTNHSHPFSMLETLGFSVCFLYVSL